MPVGRRSPRGCRRCSRWPPTSEIRSGSSRSGIRSGSSRSGGSQRTLDRGEAPAESCRVGTLGSRSLPHAESTHNASAAPLIPAHPRKRSSDRGRLGRDFGARHTRSAVSVREDYRLTVVDRPAYDLADVSAIRFELHDVEPRERSIESPPTSGSRAARRTTVPGHQSPVRNACESTCASSARLLWCRQRIVVLTSAWPIPLCTWTIEA